jgi:hypothetical protein
VGNRLFWDASFFTLYAGFLKKSFNNQKRPSIAPQPAAKLEKIPFTKLLCQANYKTH